MTKFEKNINLANEYGYFNDATGDTFDYLCTKYGVENLNDDSWVAYQRIVFKDLPDSVTVIWESDADDDGEPLRSLDELQNENIDIKMGDGEEQTVYVDDKCYIYAVTYALGDWEAGEEWFKNNFVGKGE